MMMVQLDALEFDISQIRHNCEIYNVEGSSIIDDAARLVEDLTTALNPFRDEGMISSSNLTQY
jgi:hypothetical protein